MTYNELIKKFVEWFWRSLKERWTKDTDLDKSLKHIMSRHGKCFRGMSFYKTTTNETMPGRLHNFAKRLHLSQIAKDVNAILIMTAALVTIFS